MKKLFPVFFLLITASHAAYSQGLQGTTWSVYLVGGQFLEYFHFGTDSLYYSTDAVTYIPSSLYSESGSTVTIVDLPGFTCSTTDTGRYDFMILNDTLYYLMNSDPCMSRVGITTTAYWVMEPTGISQFPKHSAPRFFPNPAAAGQLDLRFSGLSADRTRLTLVNSAGGVIEEQAVSGFPTGEIHFHTVPPGFYMIRLEDHANVYLYKLLVQ